MRINYFKLVFLVAAWPVGLWLIIECEDFGFVHRIDLVFHEAGHMIFGIFGWRNLTIFGGTLMQILVPAAFVGHFFFHGQRYSAAIVGIWLAQSIADCVPYIRDARTMDLILIGGLTGLENGAHDWNNLLFDLDILHYDQLIGDVFFVSAVLVMAVSLVMGLYYSRIKPDEYF